MLEGTIVLDLNGDAASKFLRAPMGSLGKAHDRGQSCLPLRVAACTSREVPSTLGGRSGVWLSRSLL